MLLGKGNISYSVLKYWWVIALVQMKQNPLEYFGDNFGLRWGSSWKLPLLYNKACENISAWPLLHENDNV